LDLKDIRMGWCRLDWHGSGQGPVEISCEYGIKPSGSMKCWEVLEWLPNEWLLNKGST
jgi:hypothetical protein